MNNPYYEQYLANLAQRDADSLVLLIVCLGAALVYLLAARLGKPTQYITIAIYAVLFFSIFFGVSQ
jgi:lipopolysaccharide export LptBFGC system permease protein LptF